MNRIHTHTHTSWCVWGTRRNAGVCFIRCQVHLCPVWRHSDKTAAAASSCRLPHPPPVITLESLWLCTPFYYCQPIKTKASGIRRIKLYTWEQDLREEILSTASITPSGITTNLCTAVKSGHWLVRLRLERAWPRRGAVLMSRWGYLCPVLLLGVGVHVGESSQHQSFHQGPLHRTGQQVEGGAAAGKLLCQVPPALTLHHDVSPGRTDGHVDSACFRQIYDFAKWLSTWIKAFFSLKKLTFDELWKAQEQINNFPLQNCSVIIG